MADGRSRLLESAFRLQCFPVCHNANLSEGRDDLEVGHLPVALKQRTRRSDVIVEVTPTRDGRQLELKCGKRRETSRKCTEYGSS